MSGKHTDGMPPETNDNLSAGARNVFPLPGSLPLTEQLNKTVETFPCRLTMSILIAVSHYPIKYASLSKLLHLVTFCIIPASMLF